MLTVLIPKSEDEVKLLQMTGYRPITLCHVDYKMLTKIATDHHQAVISSLMRAYHTCGIRGRNIHTNPHIMCSVLDCCLMNGDSVAMLKIYLEKAFDSVRHDFLFGILEHIGIGNVIFRGVKMAYIQLFNETYYK